MRTLREFTLESGAVFGEFVGESVGGDLVGVAGGELLHGLAEHAGERLQVEVYWVESVEHGLALTRQRGVL